jgi:hypothetical protein
MTGLQWQRFALTLLSHCSGTLSFARDKNRSDDRLEPVLYISTCFWLNLRLRLEPEERRRLNVRRYTRSVLRILYWKPFGLVDLVSLTKNASRKIIYYSFWFDIHIGLVPKLFYLLSFLVRYPHWSRSKNILLWQAYSGITESMRISATEGLP